MTNLEWMVATKTKEEIINSLVHDCPGGAATCVHRNDLGFNCADCWTDWLGEEHKNDT